MAWPPQRLDLNIITSILRLQKDIETAETSKIHRKKTVFSSPRC